ncbi:MAG: HAD-IA family hydrolase [Candidatus Lokiarchaeota archaeon]
MKWIIIDGMGVIFINREIVKSYLLPFLKEKKVNLTEEIIIKTYQEATLGKISSYLFWKKIGLINSYPDIEHEYLSMFEVDSEFYDVASYLKTMFHLAFISNDIKEWSKFLRKKFDLNKFFDVIVVSGEEGFRKPNSSIFKCLLKNADVLPQECLLVDDSLRNLQSAAKIGFKTIRFIREQHKINFCSEFEISSFRELKFIIESSFSKK